MTNPVADKLEAACATAPYVIEKERYKMAAEEIRRLQAIVDSITVEESQAGDLKVYEGSPWHADESDDCVRIFRNHMQIIKAPKRGTPYEEYWPEPHMVEFILECLNRSEQESRANEIG